MKSLITYFIVTVSLLGCSSVQNIQEQSLNGSWEMQKMNGTDLNSDDLIKGLPVFHFDLTENRFYGHAGCNQISSAIALKDHEVTFNLIISTKMACPDMSVEDTVLKVLSGNTLHYAVSGDRLSLTSPDGTVMEFIMQR